ncbi:ceramide synthase 1 isoform X2 [Ovis aries]|uniref:ceramide synthase 1 isoform X2 n=1 Tax=Ovis aries TaxID=9940 RepID=UPI002952758A|nr:ceramide synthase 1 isoform X2 [Ovis aries]
MGARGRSGPSWVQAWRAAGQMPAPPLPRPPAPGFPPLENEPERWPASRTRRDNAGTCTPEVDAAGASGGPSYRAPRNRKRRAPSLRGGASASPAPSSQELPPARPPAQLQRVTRGARLRRPPWAGADCRGGRERRHGGGGVGGARAHAELRAAGAARLGQRAGGGAGLRGLRLGACSPRPGRARAPGAARAAAAGPRRARLDRAALGGHLAPLSDWKTGMAVPRDIAVAYLLQGSFYGHSIYATLYLDAWRKDSVVMLVHHVVTLVLIVSSYAFRYHKVGILVLFLHDISDVQLEFTKLNVYFKSRGGAHQRLHALAADLGCLSFCLSWFWFRLYWFPLKVLYATSYCSLRSVPDIPFYFFFNVLLLLLTLMNLYWFLYIVAFAAKVLTGQVRELKDVREYDTAEAPSPKPRKAEKPLRNGLVKDKRF